MATTTQFKPPRLGYEALELSRVTTSSSHITQYISRYPAWRARVDLPEGVAEQPTKTKTTEKSAPGVFGGLVYAQAPLAAARAVEFEEQHAKDRKKGLMGIHSIQGVFTLAGHADRPFVHEVTQVHTGNSFATRFVQTRQPTQPSIPETGPFDPADAAKELSGVCFTCLTTFKRSRSSPDEAQEGDSVQKRFADILSAKRPDEWEPCRLVHIDTVHDAVRGQTPNIGHGTFPILDMYQVDMTAYNKDKDVAQRRELILYRPFKPIPQDDPNCHVACHAFEADRNGLTMLGCHLGYGYKWGRAASLSYSFYMHVNAEEAVMDTEGWWIQEACWPRVSAGRCMLVSKIWSPDGKHVASGYQDGMIVPEDMSKL